MPVPRTLRILLVEDDPLQAKLARVALEVAGFSAPTLVGTAAEALARAPDHDLVLLDVQLPDGDGLEVLRQLRERSSRPAVVIVTGHGGERTAAHALRLGADDYISKDVGFTDILPTVVERVRRSLALRDALESSERDVVEAERRSAVGEMTVALHHELNNPLMAALTEAALLLDEPGLSPAAREGIVRIRTALERIKDVVKRAGAADGARSTDYLAGSLKMADLAVGGVMRGVRGRALVGAGEGSLRRLISVLLRRVGFEPEAFDTLEEVVARLTNGPPPAVVVLAGFGQADVPSAAPIVRADRSWRVVVLATPGALDEREQACDLKLPLPFDPATFAPQVVTVVEERGGG